MAKTTYAILSDLSGVEQTDDGFGRFATEREANERLVEMLLAERERVSGLLSKARRRARILKGGLARG